jgi:hypothetical protein
VGLEDLVIYEIIVTEVDLIARSANAGKVTEFENYAGEIIPDG